jgi:hypothetical protein
MQSNPAAVRWAAPSLGRLTLPSLVILYLLAIFLVQPSGDFPLNDDWSYAVLVRTLLFDHDWRPSGWNSAPIITQSLLAAPFCLFTTCSYEALRVFSLVCGLVLLVSSYFLFRRVTRSEFTAGLATTAVALNPVNFQLSFTFMTDIPFAALLTLSMLAFLKTLRSDSIALYVAACLLAVAATLCRQLGLCVPLAYLAMSAFVPGLRGRRIVRAALPLVLCISTFALFELWLQQTGRLPALYHQNEGVILSNLRDPALLIKLVIANLTIAFLYFGLFGLPVLILRQLPPVGWPNPWLRWTPRCVAAVAVLCACIVFSLVRMMPAGHNILIKQGLGPLTLRDGYVLGLDNVPSLPVPFWVVVTALSVIGLFKLAELVASFSLRLIIERGDVTAEGRTDAVFAFLCTGAYLTPLIVGRFFDRYLMAFLPIVLMFVLAATTAVPREHLWRNAVAGALCAAFAIFAVLGTHDYLSWNRARWEAIADAQRLDGATVTTMDGGFEFNGSTSYDAAYVQSPDKSWWWVKGDTFQITFGPVPGMTELRRYPYVNYLPPATRHIYLLRR